MGERPCHNFEALRLDLPAARGASSLRDLSRCRSAQSLWPSMVVIRMTPGRAPRQSRGDWRRRWTVAGVIFGDALCSGSVQRLHPSSSSAADVGVAA
jgi:hypothetical protein